MWLTTFNAQHGDPNLADALAALTATSRGDARPAVLAIQEAAETAHRQALENLPGYVNHQGPGPTKGHVALLVRHDVTVHRAGLMLLSERQHVGRDVPGARTDGMTATRYLPWLTVTDPGTGRHVTIGGWHPVPGASHDLAAARLLRGEAITAAAWMRHHRHPVALLGDCNARPGSVHLAPLRAVAAPAFAASFKGAPIDGAWIRGGVGQAAALRVGTSDHLPVTVNVRWRRPHPQHPAGKR